MWIYREVNFLLHRYVIFYRIVPQLLDTEVYIQYFSEHHYAYYFSPLHIFLMRNLRNRIIAYKKGLFLMFLIRISKVLSQMYTITNGDWEGLFNLKYYHLKMLLNVSVLTCECPPATLYCTVDYKHAVWLF